MQVLGKIKYLFTHMLCFISNYEKSNGQSEPTSLVAQTVKRLPAMQETWVQSLSWEDPLEKGNGNPLQYSCLEIPNPWGCKRVRHAWATNQQHGSKAQTGQHYSERQ